MKNEAGTGLVGLGESPRGFKAYHKAQGGLGVELIRGLASSFFSKGDSEVA